MKYKNKKCSYEFQHQMYHFDSKAEMEYFKILADKARQFKIDKLKLQPRYQISEPFSIKTDKTKRGISRIGAMVYTPDFEFIANGKKTVVEVKGKITTDYRMRLKMFLSIAWVEYGIDTFIEVLRDKEIVYDCKSVKDIL